jgi:ribosome biogenesis GTPase / thiamine phosphate phosphatase
LSSHYLGGTLAALGWTPRLDAALAALGRPELTPARVAAVHRGRLELLGPGAPLSGAPSGRMIHSAATAADLPAVGDWVAADPESGVVHALLPRKGGSPGPPAPGAPSRRCSPRTSTWRWSSGR